MTPHSGPPSHRDVPEMAKPRTMESPTALPFQLIIYGIFQSGDVPGFNPTKNGHSWVCINANSQWERLAIFYLCACWRSIIVPNAYVHITGQNTASTVVKEPALLYSPRHQKGKFILTCCVMLMVIPNHTPSLLERLPRE